MEQKVEITIHHPGTIIRMAQIRNRLSANVPGEFFVDSSCIDCGACEWLAPETFEDHRGMSRVFRQPETPAEKVRALMSVLACPVSAIGTESRQDYTRAEQLLPEQVDGWVHYCGYHSSKSYGAASYLIRRPRGNILVDSPRFAKPLVRRIEELGGVSLLFLTHKDDVADHEKFRRHFGCLRILHQADITGETRNIEIRLEGNDPHRLDDDTLIVPVPGHTAGSCCLLWNDTYLFTGDHLSWDPGRQKLRASRSTCWHDWQSQTNSMKRLAGFRFEWVLPGHGVRGHLTAPRMAEEMERLVISMQAS